MQSPITLPSSMLRAATASWCRGVCSRGSGCRNARCLNGRPGLSSVQRLDLALLVDAQHQRLVGRIQVQAHDVAQFLDEPLVAAELEGLRQVGLETVLLPDAPDRGFAEP